MPPGSLHIANLGKKNDFCEIWIEMQIFCIILMDSSESFLIFLPELFVQVMAWYVREK